VVIIEGMNPVTSEEKVDVAEYRFCGASSAIYLDSVESPPIEGSKIEEHTLRSKICFEKDAGLFQQCRNC
jgi:hypothetical protein